MVGRTVEAERLQIGYEVRDGAFVDALSLTEDVKLWSKNIQV